MLDAIRETMSRRKGYADYEAYRRASEIGHNVHGRVVSNPEAVKSHEIVSDIVTKKRKSAEKKHFNKPEKFIQEVVSKMKKGTFTEEAAKHKMNVEAFADEVKAHPDKYSLTTRRRAQFLINIRKKGVKYNKGPPSKKVGFNKIVGGTKMKMNALAMPEAKGY